MAVHKSAKKSVRQDREKRLKNRSWKSKIKTAGTKIEAALDKNDGEALDSLYREYVSIVDRAVSSGVIHKKLAARKKSRLAQKIKSTQAAK